VGISSCLLGEEVRWDGGHQRHSFLVEVLGPRVEWVKVCPELEAGLGVPREAMAFVRSEGGRALMGAESGGDLTVRMRTAAVARADELAASDLCGYVLKSNSPSCGLGGARVYETLVDLRNDGPFERSARGVFAEALVAASPELPVVEETALDDRGGRVHFVERVFAHARLRAMEDLTEFHARHELQIVSHSSAARKRLDELAEEDRRDEYTAGFAAALAIRATRERHAGTLRRAWNRVHGRLGGESYRAVDAAIRDYAEGGELDPARALLAAAAREIGDRVLIGQTYLEPHPVELEVRALA
jgi:uncharacterized protein YbbK (DUF523 family)/uncharacterized protein YbgA (DUF1722 family)